MGRIVPQRLGGGLRRERKPITAQRRQARPEKEEGNAWRDLANVTKGIGDVTQILGSPLTMPIAYGLHKAFTGAPEAPLTPEEKAEMGQWKKWMSPKSAGAPSETAQNPPMTPGQQQLQAQMMGPMQEAIQSIESMSNSPLAPTGAGQDQGFGMPEKLDFPGSYKLDEPGLSQLNPISTSPAGAFDVGALGSAGLSPQDFRADTGVSDLGRPQIAGATNPLSGALINTGGLMRDPEIPRTFYEDRLSPGLESMGVPGHSVATSYRIPGGDKAPLSSFLYGASGPERQRALEAQSAGPNYLPAPVLPPDPGVNQIQQAAQREIAPELPSPQAKSPYGGVTEDDLMAFLSGAVGAPQEAPTGPRVDPQGMAPQGPPMPPLQGITDHQSAQAFLEQFQPPDPTLPPPDILENMSVDQLAALMSRATDETDVEALKSYARNEEMPRSLLDLMTGGPGSRVDKAFAGKEMYRRPRLSAKDVVDLQYKTEALRSMRGKERRAESGERRKEDLHPHDVTKSKWDAKKSEDSAKLTALRLQRKLSRKGTNINAQRRLILKKLRKALGDNATNEQKLNWINQKHPNFIQTAAFVGAHSKGLTGRDYDGFDGMQRLDHAGHAIFHLRSWPKHPKLLKSTTPSTGAQDSAEIEFNDAVLDERNFSRHALTELERLASDEASMTAIVQDAVSRSRGEGPELSGAAKNTLQALGIKPSTVTPVLGETSYELVKRAAKNKEIKLKEATESKRSADKIRKK